MSELKPCPFCGSQGGARKRTCDIGSVYDPLDRAYPLVRCINCCADIPGENWSEPETAITKWNQRPIEDALRTELAKAREDIRNLRKQNDALLDTAEMYREALEKNIEQCRKTYKWVGHKCDAQIACDAVVQRSMAALKGEVK